MGVSTDICPHHPQGRTTMKRMDLEAVYENRSLKLPCDLPLQAGQKVTITVHSTESSVDRLYGMIQWKGTRGELDNWLNDPDEGQWGGRDI
jgi:predicted DNA-binding antitoxin AbrB/MazE fold protein